MHIKAHVKDGYLAFECEGVLVEPLRKIVLNRPTHTFHFIFDWSGDDVELDCPLDTETMAAIKDHDKCGIGFYFRGRMIGAKIVPLEMRT